MQIFRMLASKEHELGLLITVEGNMLKIWFETVAELVMLLGEVSFESTYGAGTPFTLHPPFGILQVLWRTSKWPASHKSSESVQ